MVIEVHGGSLAGHKRSKQHIRNLARAKRDRRRTDITKEEFDGITWHTI